jgi:hypothetical protein
VCRSNGLHKYFYSRQTHGYFLLNYKSLSLFILTTGGDQEIYYLMEKLLKWTDDMITAVPTETDRHINTTYKSNKNNT